MVGEAPGYQEDARGGPFVGPAGQLLQEQLRIHKVIPERLFWMNVVSCFPFKPDDSGLKMAKPSVKSIAACNKNAWDQIRLANPQWVVMVGGVAMETLAPWQIWGCKPRTITQMRGLVWTWEGIHWTSIIHPAAALREAKYRVLFEKDMNRLVTMLKNGPDYSEECFLCGLTVARYDYTGMPFCSSHFRDVEFRGDKGANVESKADLRDGSSA